MATELVIIARFHVREGAEAAAIEALGENIGPTRAEEGCLGIQMFQSIRDARLFHIHSRWKDEAAFERHAEEPHTVRFLGKMEAITDEAREVSRAKLLV